MAMIRLRPTLQSYIRKTHNQAGQKWISLESIRIALEKVGYRSQPTTMRGVSGVEHNFDLVVASQDGTRLGYLISERPTVPEVMRAFILQRDCEFTVRLVCKDQPGRDAQELADSYGVKLISEESPPSQLV
jgi:hypothetical protein